MLSGSVPHDTVYSNIIRQLHNAVWALKLKIRETALYLIGFPDFACLIETSVRTAIQSLLLFYDHHGQAAPVYLPLVGTGRSRAGLSYVKSYMLIVDQIMGMKDNLQGNIHIVAQSDAFAEIQQAVAEEGRFT